MRHFQIRSVSSVPLFVHLDSVTDCLYDGKVKKMVSSNLNVDQFFSLKANLFCGHIDTSPLACASAASASHVTPVGAERPWPSDTPTDVIAASVVSKHCQSLADVQKLSGLKPNEADFLDDIKDDSSSVGDSSVTE